MDWGQSGSVIWASDKVRCLRHVPLGGGLGADPLHWTNQLAQEHLMFPQIRWRRWQERDLGILAVTTAPVTQIDVRKWVDG